jgi:hypothetical protein
VGASPHLFRPTYPGFLVEAGRVERLHAAFFKGKPHTHPSVMLWVGNPGNAGANMGHTRGVAGLLRLICEGEGKQRRACRDDYVLLAVKLVGDRCRVDGRA